MGGKYKCEKRELLDAVFYLVDSGSKWRQILHDFPPAFTVNSFYRRAKLSGLWDKILQHLVKLTRKNAGLDEMTLKPFKMGSRFCIFRLIAPHGWQVISPRWVIERSWTWLNHSRWLNKFNVISGGYG